MPLFHSCSQFSRVVGEGQPFMAYYLEGERGEGWGGNREAGGGGERWAGLSRSLFSAPEEKKGAGGGGGPVRLRSMSRKDSISEDEMVLRERSYDYQFRYCGHCNTTTDIKEANFFGRSEALRRRRRAQPRWQQEVEGGVGT